jgi:DNA topoisomerase-1
MTVTKRRRRGAATPPLDPAEAARAASLRYVTDRQPGIRRLGAPGRFRYVGPDGSPVRDPAALKRIRSLVVPPAWTEVWICAQPNGHIQATGRDARGRKQYRYHARWRAVRDETKYGRMVLFGETLPRIRSAVQVDLELPGLQRNRILAIVVRLLETTFIRVGNEEYARANKSFGLTTLKNRHVDVQGTRIKFRFVGKSRKAHEIQVSDQRLARLVKRVRDLPGQDLFQYLNDAGEPEPISSADVNDYLRAISGEEFTAKDFRTWAGTLLMVARLAEADPIAAGDGGKSAVVAAVAAVAEDLGNTATVCRKCYIHPAVIEAYQDPQAYQLWTRSAARADDRPGLSETEAALLRYLVAHQARTEARAA